MDHTTLLQAILLGVIEGITEFLPVSSTGHLILLVDLLGFKGPPGKMFEVIIQLGAIFAVCVVYRDRLRTMVLHPEKQISRRFGGNLLLAFLPAAIIGALTHEYIKNHFFTPHTVSLLLVLGGVGMLLIERFKPAPRYDDVFAFPARLSLKIGLCQAFALLPGVSRSGATIMGALAFGAGRKAATEFSFFLAIPTMFGATIYDVYKYHHIMTPDNIGLIAAGFVSAFLSALLVVRALVDFVGRHGFGMFAWYRIALGCGMLYLLA